MATQVRPKKFRHGHGAEVRAIQVTEDNYINVANWTKSPGALAIVKVDGNGDESDHRVRIRTPFGIRTAKVGDYVYKDLDDEQFYVAKEDVFEAEFVPIAPTPRNKKEKE